MCHLTSRRASMICASIDIFASASPNQHPLRRMGLSAVALFINSRVDVLMRTCHSVIYSDKSEPGCVVKAEMIWIDDTPYDAPKMTAETSSDLTREHTIYMALGSHPNVTTCFDLVHDRDGNAIALKLERAFKGNPRHFIEDNPDVPHMAKRLEMAASLAEGVAFLHSRGVIWGDLYARNVLVFDNNHLKLCDFASSVLKDVYPEFGRHTYEMQYCPAWPHDKVEALPMMQRELYALGSAVYEITLWKAPYAGIEGEIWDIVKGGAMPVIEDDNAAREIITRCWEFEYHSAEAVANDLADLGMRIEQALATRGKRPQIIAEMSR